MRNFSANDVVLVKYPFTSYSDLKVRPAIIVGVASYSEDVIIVPLTSRQPSCADAGFVLAEWKSAGLHVPTFVKRGFFTLDSDLVLKRLAALHEQDITILTLYMRKWLGFSN